MGSLLYCKIYVLSAITHRMTEALRVNFEVKEVRSNCPRLLLNYPLSFLPFKFQDICICTSEYSKLIIGAWTNGYKLVKILNPFLGLWD